MALTTEDVTILVARASTLWERLGAAFEPDDAAPRIDGGDAMVASRLTRWREVTARGDEATFRMRLAWDGLEPEQMARALGPVRLAPGQPLPSWARTLADALRAIAEPVSAVHTGRPTDVLDPEKPLPFQELFLPFVLFARDELLRRSPAAYEQLSEAARRSLERSLLWRLTSRGAQVLELEFSVYRAQHCSPFAQQLLRLLPTTSRDLYDGFLASLRGDGLIALLREYSVLGREVATVVEQWVATMTDLLDHLAADWEALQETFGGEAPLGQVAAVETGLSDPHNGGRSVMVLTFDSARKVVYKPKGLAVEAAYVDLLRFLNERGAPLELAVLRVLSRADHGWVAFAEHAPCRSEDEARRYYRRAGMLLALTWLLGMTDCHQENLFACGEWPVLVDLETLMHHRPRPWPDPEAGSDALWTAGTALYSSVLGTMLLPSWLIGRAGKAYDVSGFGAVDQQETPHRVQQWVNLNSDGLAYGLQPWQLGGQANVATLNGAVLSPLAYQEELIDGFRQMCRFLLEQRAALLAPDSPLMGLDGQRVRIVYRATKVYWTLLRQQANPELMREGVDGSIAAELLARSLVDTGQRPPFWPLLAAEHAALARLDVPYFSARSDGDALLLDDGGSVTGWAEGPTFLAVLDRLRDLSEEDLGRQIAVIRGSLYTRGAGVGHPTTEAAQESLDLASVEALSGDALVARAAAIAAELRHRAVYGPDGSATWVGLSFAPDARVWQLRPAGYDLYGGNCGIALFLAALERVTGGAGYRDLIQAALRVLERPLRDPRLGAGIGRTEGLGTSGLGSIVYALARIGNLLDEPSLLAQSREAATLITPELIAADRALDVIGGSAGAILGLLALYRETGDPPLLDRATACGHHLLERRVAGPSGLRAWPTLDRELLPGFAHGAAGIACALLRLHRATGEPEYREAALEALAWERDVLSSSPDGHAPPKRPSKGWCYGAAGVLLSRLDALSGLDDAELGRDAERAIEAAAASDLAGPSDTPCCGVLGRVDALLAAAARLDRPALRATAERQITWIVARAERDGRFLLAPAYPEEIYVPGLFQGTAGVGYMLLRLAYPEVLPSFLVWE